MNPVVRRILNACRDGDRKAHRRFARNGALIECAPVVAEKAGVKRAPDFLAMSSRKRGGGERARLPAHTATDASGRVEGLAPQGYAHKGGSRPADPTRPVPAAPPADFRARGAGGPAAPAGGSMPPAGAACPRTAPALGLAPPSTLPSPQGGGEPPPPGALRFSSLSGFRRR